MDLEPGDLAGLSVVDRNGKSLGTISTVHESGWLSVSGGFMHRHALVPISGAVREDDTVRVPFEASVVHSAPHVNLDAVLDPYRSDERRDAADSPDADLGTVRAEDKAAAGTDVWALYEHYGIAFGHPEAPAAADPEVEVGFGQVAPDGTQVSVRPAQG